MTGGKPIAVWLQPISGESAINPLIAFYDHPWKKERVAILLICPGHHTRQKIENSLCFLLFLLLNKVNVKNNIFLS
jgi:hypothetical protein